MVMGNSASHASFGTSNARMYISLSLPGTCVKSTSVGGGNVTGVMNFFDVYVYANDTDGNEYTAGQTTLTATRTYTGASNTNYDRTASPITISTHIGIVPSKSERPLYEIKIVPSYEFITSSTCATSEVGEWEDDTE
jgi:hypothetical protein